MAGRVPRARRLAPRRPAADIPAALEPDPDAVTESPLPALSPDLSELIDGVLGWIIAKIEGREGFSALMVSRHADGTRASHYHADEVEPALELALADLSGSLAGARGYALAYDARIRGESGPEPVFLVRVEEAGMARAHELALRYTLAQEGETITIQADRHLRPTGRTFPPALGA